MLDVIYNISDWQKDVKIDMGRKDATIINSWYGNR
jgi:hypothetical protein